MTSRILTITKNACFKLSKICKENNTNNILFYIKEVDVMDIIMFLSH